MFEENNFMEGKADEEKIKSYDPYNDPIAQKIQWRDYIEQPDLTKEFNLKIMRKSSLKLVLRKKNYKLFK